MTSQGETNIEDRLGMAGKIVRAFINSKLTPLIVVVSVILGAGAVLLLPREEEPQIRVPMVDVIVSMPGFSAKEVEERATRPMEKLLWEIPGVEYIYSISRPGESLVIVRFKVGEDVERSLVKLNQKLQANFDRIPQGVSFPLVKPKSIDDVPILALTFHSSVLDHMELRRIAAQVDDAVKQVPLVAETSLIGGARRQARVLLDPARLASRYVSINQVAQTLRQANRQFQAGRITTQNREIQVETGNFIQNIFELGNIVVAVHEGRPVYLREVAEIQDQAEEPSQHVFHGFGSVSVAEADRPAVTLAIAKRPGANATAVAHAVLEKVNLMKGQVIPSEVEVSITRNYGETAAEKSNELLFHMALAVLSVSLLILFILGWRESVIVAVAIPSTLALTLLIFYLYGFTLNRITLFALIFSIGILVDDAIVVVENIVRHFNLPDNSGRSFSSIAIRAVNEVGNPTVLATFAVIFAVLPMAFVGGLMGPYMRPIPIGASAAMAFSLLIAFIVTPWAAVRVLRWMQGEQRLKAHSSESATTEHREDYLTRVYRRVMGPLIHERLWRWSFLAGITILLMASMALVWIGWVKVKMLPFDNKSEFQVILNMPEGTPLEHTARVARELASEIKKLPEVTNYQIYVGTSAPFNFNGLVRHYFLRRAPNLADIQVNLVGKQDRSAQSHDIAKRIRPRLAAIATSHGARLAIAEVPPGPPVLQTLVAEIYGPDEISRRSLLAELRAIFQNTEGVVDLDWYLEADQPKAQFVVDREKAALHGITVEAISQTLRVANAGEAIDLLHLSREKEDVPIFLHLQRANRAQPEDLLNLYLTTRAKLDQTERKTPSRISLREVVSIQRSISDKAIYHKNLMPVDYLLGDVAGKIESPAYAIFQMNKAIRNLPPGKFGGAGPLPILNSVQPFSEFHPAMKWDGEWHITIEVFRDLGLAFGAVLILIYVLMVGWFHSFVTPLIVMAAIPFSLVGILPAHAALGAFFTATSMIGFMAGAGIVVRNSIILVDFIEQRISEGMTLEKAVVEAGAVRFRPMLLTALAVVAGAGVILFDPIFQGLAIALMAGEIASLLISRMAVPVIYSIVFRNRKFEPR